MRLFCFQIIPGEIWKRHILKGRVKGNQNEIMLEIPTQFSALWMFHIFQDLSHNYNILTIALFKVTTFKPVLVQQSCRGAYWFHSVHLSVRPSVRPSVCPASCVHSVAPTVLVGSISYLHILSITSKGMSHVKFLAKLKKLNFWQFLKICNFDFVFFWLGIWCESLAWVIIGRKASGISERRRSSCSSWTCLPKIVASTYH